MKGTAGAAKASKSPAGEQAAQNVRQPAPSTGTTGAFRVLQKTVGNRAVSGLVDGRLPQSVRTALRSPSRALDADTRGLMESQFGHDLGAVRVHDDAAAAHSAESLAARAFTIGQDLFFARGRYAPGTMEGRRLLAHELAHAIQQSQLRAADGVGAEREAASIGRLAAVGAPVSVQGSAPMGIQCELMHRETAEKKLQQLKGEIADKEKLFADKGLDPAKDQDYQNSVKEYQELDSQLKKNQLNSNRILPQRFGKAEPLDKVTLPDGQVIDLRPAPAKDPPASPPKGERPLPITISPFGKPITLMEENIPDPIRRRRIHNLKVDIKALKDQEQAARWAWQQALSEWKVVRWTADQIAGARPPSFELLSVILQTTTEASKALAAGELDEADRLVQRAQRQVVDASREWHRYRNKNIGGAESLQTGLEYTRDAAFLTLAILAPGAGSAGAWIATGAPIAAEAAETLAQVAMGDKIDWTMKVVSIVVRVVLARFMGHRAD